LEETFSNAKLRRHSSEPNATNATSASAPMPNLRREQSESVIQSSSLPDPFLTKLRQEQSDQGVPTTFASTPSTGPANRRGSTGHPTANAVNIGNSSNGMATPNNPTVNAGSNMNALAQQQQVANQQLQQQILANIRQQQNLATQQNRATHMNVNGQVNNNPMMAAAMMGGNNNNMVMMNQLQQQQMNLNLLQQQQQHNRQGVGMPNMGLFQQQNAAMFMGNVPQNNAMNMVNFPLPNVIPGVGGNFTNNFNNGPAMLPGDSSTMPPPSTMNAAANTPHPRNPSGHDGISPLSPGSFHW
jgi:hypothetical protein